MKRAIEEPGEAERLGAIIALAWRPAWSMRRRVGCLAPLIAWWRR